MRVLRVPVICCRCGEGVEKSGAITIEFQGKKDYECYPCYQTHSAWNAYSQEVKKSLYCQRCNYKFTSKRLECPYCNKMDLVIDSEINVDELL